MVTPVYAPAVRGLCARPYPGHPRGCPNLNHKAHAARLGALHPGWSDRQRRCCRYWQGTARNALAQRITAFLATAPGYAVSRCPEALGLDVTATLRRAGGVIEWPPVNIVRTVALAGVPLNGGPP
jgi:hypothetical protein